MEPPRVTVELPVMVSDLTEKKSHCHRVAA